MKMNILCFACKNLTEDTAEAGSPESRNTYSGMWETGQTWQQTHRNRDNELAKSKETLESIYLMILITK